MPLESSSGVKILGEVTGQRLAITTHCASAVPHWFVAVPSSVRNDSRQSCGKKSELKFKDSPAVSSMISPSQYNIQSYELAHPEGFRLITSTSFGHTTKVSPEEGTAEMAGIEEIVTSTDET